MGVVRKTKTLELILAEFDKNAGAIAAVSLVKRLTSKFNKTTIYRILERLEDDGVLHSFTGHNGVKWYAKCNGCSSDGHIDVHPHFHCLTCGVVECISLEIQIPAIPNRKVLTSQVLLEGTCARCLQ